MKLIFKIFNVLLITVNTVCARDIILIESMESKDNTERLVKIITNKFNIPRSFITTKTVSACSLKNSSVMQLCLKQEMNLEIIHMDKYVIRNVLSDFITMER